MKNLLSTLALAILFFASSCSDGTLISSEISTIIKKQKITKVAVRNVNAPTVDLFTYQLVPKKYDLEGSFLIVGKEYLNLASLVKLETQGKQLILFY